MTRGRRRSETSRVAILEAARALLVETGYEGLTIDAIARHAGVGKQTIYRWWNSKGEVIADAALRGDLLPSMDPLPDTGDLRADLRDWLGARIAHITSPGGESLVLALTAATVENRSMAHALYSRFSGPHEELVHARLEAARRAGQLPADAPIAAVSAMMIGALVYRVLGRHERLRVGDADLIVDVALWGAAAGSDPLP